MFSSQNSQVSSAANYIEDVFSTYLYTGTATIDTEIVNGINLRDYGGLVWIKKRNAVSNHSLFDSARGYDGTNDNRIYTNSTSAQVTGACDWAGVPSYVNYGFVLNGNGTSDRVNESGVPYTSWTFRKQPKFFDVVTYTGNGANRTISHNLGSVPGCIIVKRTNAVSNWRVYHNGFTSAEYSSILNSSATEASTPTVWNSTAPTSSVFSVGTSNDVNANGSTYVAYIFAHDAGGFGLTGADNVISCGSLTTNASGEATVTLGYEPQWLLCKQSGVSGGPWFLIDTMRRWDQSGYSYIFAHLDVAEDFSAGYWVPTATGFSTNVLNSSTKYIYIAIRRGPMKVPTSGTSVFSPNASSAATNTAITTNFPIDLQIQQYRSGSGANWYDRLRGISTTTTASGLELGSAYTGGESSAPGTRLWGNTGFTLSSYTSGAPFIYWNLRRAPSFFDVVCYTGTGSARTVTHNLGVAPEMMIVKTRSSVNQWSIYHKDIGNNYGLWFTSNAKDLDTYWNDTTPTNTVFTVGPKDGTNQSGQTIVAYLFATCAGVSKVGSYTGTGTTKQVDCGFTGGARFVLIKRTDSTGDWYVWDTARGIVSGNDPYLLMNSSAAEVTTTDYIDTYSAGFEISSTAPAAINASGGTFIFLAIA